MKPSSRQGSGAVPALIGIISKFVTTANSNSHFIIVAPLFQTSHHLLMTSLSALQARCTRDAPCQGYHNANHSRNVSEHIWRGRVSVHVKCHSLANYSCVWLRLYLEYNPRHANNSKNAISCMLPSLLPPVCVSVSVHALGHPTSQGWCDARECCTKHKSMWCVRLTSHNT